MIFKSIRTTFGILPAALVVFATVPLKAYEVQVIPAAVPLSQYLDYARRSADWAWSKRDEIIRKWKESFDPQAVFGYRAPGHLLEMAAIYSHFFEKEKNAEYGRRAKWVLLAYSSFRNDYPEAARKKRTDYEDGVPMLPDFFVVMRYIKTYEVLHRLGVLTEEETKKIESDIVHSLDYLLRTQEWGPMNRTALRAESLAWALRALPRHPRAGIWEMQRRAMGDDNWGNWQIEDATIYHGVWLYALLGYADAMGKREELLRTPEMYYYGFYYSRLMSPAGMVPDFGDANWESNWMNYLVFFEAAAAATRDSHLKWAASTIARRFINFDHPDNPGWGYMFLDCARWGSDAVPVRPVASLSEEVMEDVQGKKIVFRSGWMPSDTYLLLNYRDEGDGGLIFRDYLRDTIAVEEEKMTHGHADENSLVLLMSGGSVLLHDAGYRDFMPSGLFGAYRQDYFHNRLCVRPEKIFMGQPKGGFRYSVRDEVPGQNVLDFLRNAGSYRRVRTQKVDFLSLPEFDYSRTRLSDDGWGYDWDRIVVYVKQPEMFVVFDIFKAKKEDWFTLSNLWHTQKIVGRGDHWYDTAYESIQSSQLPRDKNLLILFPQTHHRLEGVDPQKRHFQNEQAIHQTWSQHFELGQTEAFVTVLIPHAAAQSPQDWLGRVSLLAADPDRAGTSLRIESGDKILIVGAKNDLRMDMVRDWRRPRYTYESGRIRFGDLESNGDFVFAEIKKQPGNPSLKLAYTIVNLTRALYRNQILFDNKPCSYGLAFDGSEDAPGVGKIRYWKGEAEIKD